MHFSKQLYKLLIYRSEGVCCTHRVNGVHQLAWFTELHETLSQVVERSLHQNLLLFIIVQQMVPERLFGESLRIAHNDHAISALTHTLIRQSSSCVIK